MTHSNPVLIPLYKHLRIFGYAIVDADDHERLSQAKWTMTHGYAVCTSGGDFGGETFMHRIVAGPKKAQVVDHINGCRYDNRKANLRGCTQQENMINKQLIRSSTGFRGVVADKRDSRYGAAIFHEGRAYRLGRFATPEEAAQAYDSAARQIHGEYAVLNFPEIEAHPDTDWVAYTAGRIGSPKSRNLTMDQAREIRALADKKTPAELAAQYNVSPGAIYLIVSGRTYREPISEEMLALALERVEKGDAHTAVASDLKLSRAALLRAIHAKWGRLTPATARRRKSNAKLSVEQVHEILRRVEAGEKQKDLAAEFGVKIATVNGYVRGRRKIQSA